jgi:hypothetical protein
VEDPPPTVEELEQEILTDFLEPIGTLGIMVADSESKTGHLKITHGYARYSSRAGHANIGRGATFCFEGEVDGTDAFTVAFDWDQMGMTLYVNVPRMPDRHQTLLTGEPTKTMVGPFEADAANVHTVRTRGAMFIPFELVALLLDKDLTAREAFLVVYSLLEDNGLVDACRLLVESLQVALTQPTAEFPAGHPPIPSRTSGSSGSCGCPPPAPRCFPLPGFASPRPLQTWAAPRHLHRDAGRWADTHISRDARRPACPGDPSL